MTAPEPTAADERAAAFARRILDVMQELVAEHSVEADNGRTWSDLATAAMAAGAQAMTGTLGPAATVSVLAGLVAIHGPQPQRLGCAPTGDERQRLREFLTDCDLRSIRNAIAAGARPDDAAVAAIGAGLNVLADTLAIQEIDALVARMLDNLRAHDRGPLN